MFMQGQRACTELRRDKAENNHEITAEVQDNYYNFKRNLAEKEKIVIPKVNGSQPVFG